MVSRPEKMGTTEYICSRLEDSGLYAVQERDHQHVLVTEKAEVREEPRTIDVVVPNFMLPVGNFVAAHHVNRNRGIYTTPILHKDGKTAFVRMVETNRSWRTDKSLKRYTPEQINKMISLRKIEKEVRERFGKNTLTYYQPETERLPESLRVFSLGVVILDYSYFRL